MAEENKQSLEDALDDLEKEIDENIKETSGEDVSELEETSFLFDKETFKTGRSPDRIEISPFGMEKDIVKVSFKDHPELKAYLEKRAQRGFRTPAMELLSMLSYSFEAKKSKKS